MAPHIGGRLTVAKVKAAGPGKHPDGANLWLQVGPNGSRSWYLRYTLNGRTREMGFGPYPLVKSSSRHAIRQPCSGAFYSTGSTRSQPAMRAQPARDPITFGAAAKQYIAGS